MKSKKILLIIPVILILYVILLLPKNIDETFEGIQYQLGQPEGSEFKNNVTVEGKITTDLLLKKRFEGYVTIEKLDTVLPQELIKQLDNRHYRYIEIDLNYNNYAPLVYSFYDPECQSVRHIPIGIIFYEGDYKNLVIALAGKETKWHSNEGWLLAAPASSRTEAIELSRDLTQYELD